MKQEVFQLAKSFSLKEFLERIGVELRKNGNSECPFCGRPDTFSVKAQDNGDMFQCFSSSCALAGDIINFCKHYFHLSTNKEAAHKVLEIFNALPDKNLSKEEKAKWEQQLAQEAQKRAKKQEEEAKAQEAQAKKIKTQLKKQLTKFRSDVITLWETHAKKAILQSFPNYANFNDNLKACVGYDSNEESIVIINEHNKELHNVKWRTKKGNEGKWVGAFGLKAHPFPLSCWDSEANYVFLLEGEKDALNLISCGINALTLGGVGNKWDNFKGLLEGKKVFVFYDNDNAGYINYVNRYNELKDIAEIFFIPFFFLNHTAPKGYDVSDFLRENEIYTQQDPTNAFKEKIIYSTIKANPHFFKELQEYCTLSANQIATLPQVEISTKEIFKEWERHIVEPKGEKAREFHLLYEAFRSVDFNEHKEAGKFAELKRAYQNLEEGVKLDFDKLFEVQSRLITNYRQIHEADVHRAFCAMTQKSLYPLAIDRERIMVWNGHYYIPLDELELQNFISTRWIFKANLQIKSHTPKNIKALIDGIKTFIPNIALTQDTTYRDFNLLNGILRVRKNGTYTLIANLSEEQKRKMKLTSGLNIEFNPNSRAPKWQKFLNEVLPNKDEQDALAQFFGYCLMPNHQYETFLFLLGTSAGNAKSVVLDTLRQFFPKQNVSSITLNALCNPHLENLAGKMLNIGTELDHKNLNDGQMENLKALTSNKDTIDINPKYQQPYTLEKSKHPKMAFAGNTKPAIGMDNGVFRRMLIIPMEISIPEKKRIRDLPDRFIDEHDGILNWALNGLSQLNKQRCFTRSKAMEEILEEYKNEANPLRVFVAESLQGDITHTSKDEIYECYKAFCEDYGNQTMSRIKFFARLKNECRANGIKISEHKHYGKRVWQGVSIKSLALKEQNDTSTIS